MRYYISDLHFYHNGLNHRMDCRGFPDAHYMNEYMIAQWNSRVRRNDEVVILGDFCLGSGTQANEIAKRLHGRKFLVAGNHDKFLKDKDFDNTNFQWIKDYAEMHDDGRKVILSHYPIFCYNGQYRLKEDGSPKTYMLYGHVHNTLDLKLVDHFQMIIRQTLRKSDSSESSKSIPCNMINCFCMFSGYVPLTLDEWINVEEKRNKTPKYDEEY